MARSLIPICGAATISILAYSATALAVDCFIDSVNGNDGNTGLAEAQAVKTQAKIPSTCTAAKFKRGSQFNEALTIGFSSKVKSFGNYGDSCDPMPRFVMPGTTNTGAVVSGQATGVTIDGLYLANSHGDGSSSSSNFGKGTCVMLGAGSIMQNCEITSCDIGVMMNGSGSKFINNYVHDLNTMIADAAQDSGVNINAVGGAEGIFVNGSDNEVAYNQFVRCKGVASWTGGGCDGGATEVSIGGSGVSGVKIHHNYSYGNCGFFEVSSSGQGTFSDSAFYDNVSVDSGWMFLIQINNTTLSNIRWENNTIIYHKSGTDTSYAPTVSMIYNGTGTSGSGNAVTGTLQPDTVFFNNNLVIYDGFGSAGSLDKNISQSNNLITTTTSGVVANIGTGGVQPAAADFELVSGSPAIDQGMSIATITTDFFNRAVPSGAAPDIGALEYGASLASGLGGPVATMDIVMGKIGCAVTTGGTSGTGGSSAVVAIGGAQSAGTSANVMGGAVAGGAVPANPGGSGANVAGATSTKTVDSESCSCRLVQSTSHRAAWLGLVGLALLGLRQRSIRI